MWQGPSSGRSSLKGRNRFPIPLELYNECRSRAKVLDASGTRFSPSNPVMERCPYDKCHAVAAHKMSSHLERCRLNYVGKMTARGYKGVRMTCKYNPRHQILPPELLFHEERCQDRAYIPFYQLYVNPYFAGEERKPLGNLETCKVIDPVELRRMQEGVYLDVFIGSDNPTTIPIPLSLIQGEEGRRAIERRAKLEAMASRAKSLAEILRLPEFATGSTGEGSAEGAAGGSVAGEESGVDGDDEEDWGRNANAPHFNYMNSCFHPKSPLYRKYPPGLTRKERRAFDTWNTEWMALILDDERKEMEAKILRDDSTNTDLTEVDYAAYPTDSDDEYDPSNYGDPSSAEDSVATDEEYDATEHEWTDTNSTCGGTSLPSDDSDASDEDYDATEDAESDAGDTDGSSEYDDVPDGYYEGDCSTNNSDDDEDDAKGGYW